MVNFIPASCAKIDGNFCSAVLAFISLKEFIPYLSFVLPPVLSLSHNLSSKGMSLSSIIWRFCFNILRFALSNSLIGSEYKLFSVASEINFWPLKYWAALVAPDPNVYAVLASLGARSFQ